MNLITKNVISELINKKQIVDKNYVLQVTELKVNNGKVCLAKMSDTINETQAIFVLKSESEIRNYSIISFLGSTIKYNNEFILIKKFIIENDNLNNCVGFPKMYNPSEANSFNGSYKKPEVKKTSVITTTSNNNNNNKKTLISNNKNNNNNIINHNNNNNNNTNNKSLENNNILEDSNLDNYTKFVDLSSFNNNIKIIVRVISVGKVISFINKVKNQSSKLLKITIVDIDSNELEVSLYDKLCEKFVGAFEENKVYVIDNVTVKVSDKVKRYKSLDYLIYFTEYTQIKQVNNLNLQKLLPYLGKTYYSDISEMNNMPTKAVFDTLVLVKSIDEPTLTKNNKPMQKLTLVSYKESICFLNLFSNSIEKAKSIKNYDIIMIKKAEVNEFKGNFNLNLTFDGYFIINEDALFNKVFPNEYNRLLEIKSDIIDNKYKSNATNYSYNLSNNKKDINNEEKVFKSINNNNSKNRDSIYNHNLSNIYEIINNVNSSLNKDINAKFDTFKINAKVKLFKRSLNDNIYLACPNCKKKLDDNNYCVKCNKNFDPNHTYKLRYSLVDSTGKITVDSFGSINDIIMKSTAKQMYESSDYESYYENLIFNNYNKDYSFVVRPKVEIYDNITKIKYNVVYISEIDMNETALYMLNKLMF